MTSTNIDLPLDILTEILSYLSLKSLLLKTCTLNRQFLKLSLDFLYQEIYLASAGPNITQTFNAIIRDQLVANRIRRIHIFSGFSFPAKPTCGLFTRDPELFAEKFNNTLVRLEELRGLIDRRDIPSDVPDEAARGGPPLLGSVPNTFDLLLPGVRELTITSVARNKYFSNILDLLKLLWEKHHVGENLRKLEVAAGTVDTLLLLIPMTRYLNRTVSTGSSGDRSVASCSVHSRNPRLCNITHLSIYFIPVFDTTCTGSDLINKHLSQLIEPLASTLSSFSLSYAFYPCARTRTIGLFDLRNPNQQDFSEVLNALPYLPALKEVKFQLPFTPKTMKNPGALTEWLRAHQDQLEQLTIKATCVANFALLDDTENNYDPGDVYSNWLTRVEGSHHRGFPSLTFAMLNSLEIRACRLEPFGQRVIPPLKRIIPSLRSLTLGYEDWLDQKEVENVLQGLPSSQEGCRGLETFHLRYHELTPGLLDLLHEKLPQLKVLMIDCDLHTSSASFYGLSKRMYTWQLSYLRITTMTWSPSRILKCVTERHFHPHLKSMEVVANCLEGDPMLDMELICGCK